MFYFTFTSLINETTLYIIFPEGGRSQQRATKSRSWSVVGEFEPAKFMSEAHDLIGLVTVSQVGGSKLLFFLPLLTLSLSLYSRCMQFAWHDSAYLYQ